MEAAGWYLMAYDIRDPSRLRKVHRVLRRQAMPVQYSVFLAQGKVSEIRQRLDALQPLLDSKVDDLRAWPVAEPASLWTCGASLIQGDLLGDGPEEEPKYPSGPSVGWRGLLTQLPDNQAA